MGGLKIKIKAPKLKLKIPSLNEIGKNINKAAIKVGKDTERELENARKGEIGHVVGKLAGGIAKGAGAVTESGKALLKGENALKPLAKGVAGITQAAIITTGYGAALYTKGSQKILRDEKLSKYTLGISKDLAGSISGVTEIGDRGNISNENRDAIFRLATKAGGIAAGVAYAPQIGGALKSAAVGATKVKATTYLGGIAAAGYLQKGNVKKAVQTLTGAEIGGLPDGSNPDQGGGGGAAPVYNPVTGETYYPPTVNYNYASGPDQTKNILIYGAIGIAALFLISKKVI